MVDAVVTLAGAVHVVIGAVRLLVILLAVLQDTITVLLACPFDVLPVSAGEGVANNRVELGILEADVQMGVIGALGAGFIAQAPIKLSPKSRTIIGCHSGS